MSQLPLSEIITVSVSAGAASAPNYNTSNLALFTDEAPNLGTFGSAGYASYVEPTSVATDFGSSSKTYEMANAVFSQQPNILAGGGELIVVLIKNAVQNLAFSAVSASGTFELEYTGGYYTAAINWDDTAAQIQTKLRAITGLENVIVTGSIASQTVSIQFAGVYGPVSLLTVQSNSLEDSLSASVSITVTTTTVGETIADAITRTANLVSYFGIMVDEDLAVIGQTDLLAAAAVVQPLNKIAFWVSSTLADIEPGGMIDLLRSGSFHKSRGLYYGNTSITKDYIYCASYAGRALSTNFTGSNTTQNMQLKALIGVDADTTITTTILGYAQASGADVYPNFEGLGGAIYTSGANQFFDQVYNLGWFVGAIQIAGVNYLAGTSTKIPQTEAGMDGLKGAYAAVGQQAVTNQYAAPGQWNSATTFGPGTALITNIANFGYYIYSVPISQQSEADRTSRISPLVQIALKEAGGINKGSVLIFINP